MVHVALVKLNVMWKSNGMNIIIQLKVHNHQNTLKATSTTISHGLYFQMLQKMLRPESIFFFFSVCCIVFNCFWQLMFDKKQKGCVKRVHLVTDDGLNDWKAFYAVKIVFYSSSIGWWQIYQ